MGARKGTHMHPKGALEGPKEPAKEKEIHEVEPSEICAPPWVTPHAYMPAPKGQ